MTSSIGQPVRRKEDFRFITGAGRYTDDMTRPRQTYAYFLRSPHAHAAIRSIDTSAAETAPGVVAVFTGKHVADDKLGGLICGWMVHSKDGSEMKAVPIKVMPAACAAHTALSRSSKEHRKNLLKKI